MAGQPATPDVSPHTPKSVAGIAFRGKKVFVACRLPGGAMGCRWEFPGGKVEAGESDEAALIREFDEELGVAVRVGRPLGAAAFEHGGKTRTLNAYEVSFDEEKLRLSVHSQWKWASLDEIDTPDFAGSDRKLLAGLSAFVKSRIQT
jgi:8-oxo-dGTP diphosphatase